MPQDEPEEKKKIDEEENDEDENPEKEEENEEETDEDEENDEEENEDDDSKSEENEENVNEKSEVAGGQKISASEMSSRIRKWFGEQGWKGNPFVLSIIPTLFVGYDDQKQKMVSCIEEKHKVCLIIGATGSGKTTALRWLSKELDKKSGFIPIFVSKPPAKPDDFVSIFNSSLFRVPWYLGFLKPLMPNIKNVHEIPEVLNSRFSGKHIVFLCDEVHEADVNVLQWMRVLSDQVENLSLIISGLPVFDDMLNSKLETFQKRITTKIVLSALSKEETREMIEKRISHSAIGEKYSNPFTDDAIEEIYKETGGFPREILRMCDRAVNEAIIKGNNKIDSSIVTFTKSEVRHENSGFDMKNMPRRQREIIEAIRSGKSTPGDIIDSISLDKYKSKNHAIRSVNNILQRLMKDGLIERERQGKTFIYILGPKLKSIAVRA